MEDVAKALLMAGNVLIFIIALTVCISSFSKLKAGVDGIMQQTETVKMATFINENNETEYINFMKSKENGAVRIVGAETVISSMIRAFKENFVLYIKFSDEVIGYIRNIEWYEANYNFPIDSSTPLIRRGDKLLKLPYDCNIHELILNNKIMLIIQDCKFYEYIGEYKEKRDEVPQDEKETHRILTYIQI